MALLDTLSYTYSIFSTRYIPFQVFATHHKWYLFVLVGWTFIRENILNDWLVKISPEGHPIASNISRPIIEAAPKLKKLK